MLFAEKVEVGTIPCKYRLCWLRIKFLQWWPESKRNVLWFYEYTYNTWSKMKILPLHWVFPMRPALTELATAEYCKKISRTAKTQYRKFKQIFPEKELRGLSPNFHTFMCLWVIYVFPGLARLFCCRRICGRLLGIYLYHSHIHEWGNWDWGRLIPFLGIHKWDLLCSARRTLRRMQTWDFRTKF